MDNRPEEGEASYDDQMESVRTQSRYVKYYETLKVERPNDHLTQQERRKAANKVWYASKRIDPEFMAKNAAQKKVYRASRSSLKKT
jgi:hypothetical protein